MISAVIDSKICNSDLGLILLRRNRAYLLPYYTIIHPSRSAALEIAAAVPLAFPRLQRKQYYHHCAAYSMALRRRLRVLSLGLVLMLAKE